MKSVLVLGTIVAMTACNSGALKASKLLRSPEGLSHNYNYQDTRTESFVAFKNKMNLFSSDLSENFNLV